MKNSSALEASPGLAAQSAPLSALWAALRTALRRVRCERRVRRLRLCETLPLGEKRLIAVVEVEGQRLLLAATAERISLLQTLSPAPSHETPASEGS